MPGRKAKREKPIASPMVPERDERLWDDQGSSRSPSVKKGRKENEQKRRVMTNQYFDELNVLLAALSERSVPKKMDKVATLRETIQCVQLYHQLTNLEQPPLIKGPSSAGTFKEAPLLDLGETLKFLLDSTDSFLALISESGRVLYTTELISSLLGHMRSRLIGQNWYNFIDERDHQLFHSLFDQANLIKGSGTAVSTFPTQTCKLRLKLYAGETGGLPQYLPFNCLAYIRKWNIADSADCSPLSPSDSFPELGPLPKEHVSVILIGKLPTSLTHVDLPISTNDVNFEFEIRVSQEGRIISVDKHAILVLGFSSADVTGTLFFDYVDPYHLMDIGETISAFMSTGLGTTTPYRFRTKSGRYIWLISKSYTSYNPWNNKPDHILLTNRILGCDQVLPEHRFYRSRKFLPNLVSEEEHYTSIEPAIAPTCQSTFTQPKGVSMVPPAFPDPYHPSRILSQMSEEHSFSSHPAQQPVLNRPPHQLPSVHAMSTPPSHNQQPPPSHNQQPPPSHNQHPPPSHDQQPPPLWTDYSSNPSAAQAATMHSGEVNKPQDSHMYAMETPSTHPIPSMPTNLEKIQMQLERKNREIFEMQKILLEQQKLFEQERNQFYQVSQQVLQCISNGGPSQVSSTSNSLSKFMTPAVVANPNKSFSSMPQSLDEVQTSSNLTKWDSSASFVAPSPHGSVTLSCNSVASGISPSPMASGLYVAPSPHNSESLDLPPPMITNAMFDSQTPHVQTSINTPHTLMNPPTHHAQTMQSTPFTSMNMQSSHSMHLANQDNYGLPLQGYPSQNPPIYPVHSESSLPQSRVPPDLTQGTSGTPTTPTLAMHNQRLMQALSMSNQFDFDQSSVPYTSAPPAISRIQSLTNLFGNH